jgi:small subunit ribosomal protein S8
MAHKENVDVPASNILKKMFDIMVANKYLDAVKPIEDKKQGILRVYIRYTGGKCAIRKIRRISRPGMRIYVDKTKIPLVLRGKGMAILSTPKGILTDSQARKEAVGGEVLAYVW